LTLAQKLLWTEGGQWESSDAAVFTNECAMQTRKPAPGAATRDHGGGGTGNSMPLETTPVTLQSKETQSMSSIANLSRASSVLPSLNIHAHGHKRGVHAQDIEDSGGGAAVQASAGATENLFGRLLQSLEKVVGVQLGRATSAAASAATSAGTPVNAAVAGASISIKA
jgi:hypothetical protein